MFPLTLCSSGPQTWYIRLSSSLCQKQGAKHIECKCPGTVLCWGAEVLDQQGGASAHEGVKSSNAVKFLNRKQQPPGLCSSLTLENNRSKRSFSKSTCFCEMLPLNGLNCRKYWVAKCRLEKVCCAPLDLMLNRVPQLHLIIQHFTRFNVNLNCY